MLETEYVNGAFEAPAFVPADVPVETEGETIPLVVKPYDFTAKGSFRIRQRLANLAGLAKKAQRTNDPELAAEALSELDALIYPRLKSLDPALTVDQILDDISGEDYDRLISAVQGQTVDP